MRELISLNKQKTLMFLPIINIGVMIVFLLNVSRVPDSQKIVLKSALILFCYMIPLKVIHKLVFNCLVKYTVALSIINIVSSYLFPLLIAFVLIKCQKRYLGKYFKD